MPSRVGKQHHILFIILSPFQSPSKAPHNSWVIWVVSSLQAAGHRYASGAQYGEGADYPPAQRGRPAGPGMERRRCLGKDGQRLRIMGHSV